MLCRHSRIMRIRYRCGRARPDGLCIDAAPLRRHSVAAAPNALNDYAADPDHGAKAVQYIGPQDRILRTSVSLRKQVGGCGVHVLSLSCADGIETLRASDFFAEVANFTPPRPSSCRPQFGRNGGLPGSGATSPASPGPACSPYGRCGVLRQPSQSRQANRIAGPASLRAANQGDYR